ncbi:uncharacterized protein LOC124690046 [Lolium rigidum]|uniref:uncharacterized protein LOC124690046 n=1 Tax=Lolium rigidum TaxID=89674 RepID=UPI001F5E1A9B|nr:uncharacterized protein LOC124690046 [Lolium rigidum]
MAEFPRMRAHAEIDEAQDGVHDQPDEEMLEQLRGMHGVLDLNFSPAQPTGMPGVLDLNLSPAQPRGMHGVLDLNSSPTQMRGLDGVLDLNLNPSQQRVLDDVPDRRDEEMQEQKRVLDDVPDRCDEEMQEQKTVLDDVLNCAQPRYGKDGLVTFDGKIGTWAFIKETPAVKKSKNREKGTIEIKPVKVTRDVMRNYLCELVIPAIQDKWPDEDEGRTIFIQQDNAKPHVLPHDEGFRQAVAQTDLDIKLLQQPPNSPDLNVLDLCFFRSLQSLTDTSAPNNIRELIHGVEEEYRNYEVNKLSRSFITLQSCMIGGAGLRNMDLLELSSHFIPGQQEDAHEFLRCLLDNLHHCTLDPKSKGKPSSFDEESIVKHVFGGRLKSQLTCRECGHCFETFEPFLDLSLEIDQVDDLIVALESFTKVEQIGDVENKLTCERCNVEVCKDKRLLLAKAPDVLTLQLKRFTTLDSSVEKIDKHVAYPSELDLKPFHSNPDTEELKYDLYGVVEHSGLPNFGHYVCAIRSSPSSWHLMDDSHVNSITETSALRHEAYVLFYVRQGMFPWFSSLIDEATKTSQQRTSVEDEINNPETPSTRRTSDHDVFAFEKLDEEDTRLMPVTEHQRKVKKPNTKFASKSVKGSFLDQSVSRLMMDMPSARRQGFLDCIITQRHEHESYSGPRSDHAVAQETICTSHASGELSCCFLRLSDALDVIASRHRGIC